MNSYVDFLINVNTIPSDDFRKHYSVILQQKSRKIHYFKDYIQILKFIQDGYHCF